MATLVYFLCALTGFAAFVLLLRSWWHSKARLLFWSALCFAGITATNILLVIDKLVIPEGDLRTPRLLIALIAVLLLLYGLIWEEE